jgi:alkanesulfonate monooxygenase SsuD/methylene tetrahydromethanopterin reductase-like flavin-dependent oxidoreductase (luciferase family)
MLAMTAAGLDAVSDGRFELGIGTSGPQVIEGFHGVPFGAPIGTTRETIEICRRVWRREPLAYSGRHFTVPLPPGQGTGLHAAARLIRGGRRRTLKIAATWPWAQEITTAWQRVQAIPHPT